MFKQRRQREDLTKAERHDTLSKEGRGMQTSKLLLVGAFLVAGCGQISPDSTETNDDHDTEAAPAGRFTIIHSPHMRRDTMLLDTSSGQTWQLVQREPGEDSDPVWQSVEMADPLPRTASN
jgi:hypothetical protein